MRRSRRRAPRLQREAHAGRTSRLERLLLTAFGQNMNWLKTLSRGPGYPAPTQRYIQLRRWLTTGALKVGSGKANGQTRGARPSKERKVAKAIPDGRGPTSVSATSENQSALARGTAFLREFFVAREEREATVLFSSTSRVLTDARCVGSDSGSVPRVSSQSFVGVAAEICSTDARLRRRCFPHDIRGRPPGRGGRAAVSLSGDDADERARALVQTRELFVEAAYDVHAVREAVPLPRGAPFTSPGGRTLAARFRTCARCRSARSARALSRRRARPSTGRRAS